MESKTTHILVIPYPAQGHLIPIIDLANHLAATRRLTITVVTTPNNLPLLSLSSLITPLVLPFPPTAGIPAGAENTKDLPPASFRHIIPALYKLKEPLRRWFDSHPSPPVAIISDMFLGWTHRFAAELGVKNVVFSPSGAMALSVIFSLWRHMPKEGDQNGDVLFKEVPNSPKYPWCQLSPIYRSYVEGDADSEFIKEGFRDDMASWGLVVNSFDELERVYLDHLVCSLGHDRVWAVGPLVLSQGHTARGGCSSVEVDKILAWLDKCRDDEVVYVSFGTQTVLTRQQMEVVAEGLERSGVRFIWSMRDPLMLQHVEGADHDTVAHGFEDRFAGRGMVIKGWAPQVTILRHRAVGTFLTHCGWNSVIEGLMAGVCMLAWPMGADQFTNAMLLVDQLKVGIRVCEGSKAIPNPSELAQILTDSMSQDQVIRQKVIKLQKVASKAVSENGSSYNALVKLVNELGELKIMPKT